MRAFSFRAMAAAVIGAAVFTAASEARAQAAHVIYRFKGGKDGANPFAGLIDVGGILYGTTRTGGTVCVGGCGTVFKLTSKGVETVYDFTGASGAYPVSALTDLGGALYGTTSEGGTGGSGGCLSGGCGTVFKLTLTPKPKLVESKSFKGGSNANTPLAGLISAAGLELSQTLLYGTTSRGGNTKYCNGAGCGTVFFMAPQNLNVVSIYRPTGGSAGAFPHAGLVHEGTSLYGTTQYGGGTGCGGSGCGTVFEVLFHTGEAAGTTRHRFQGASDGAWPYGSLINVGGALYGTTSGGGGMGCAITYGCGTVFKVTP
jgi:uncharacterized repeat protein (TIGR03803 family)